MLRFALAATVFFCLTNTASANMGAADLKRYCENKNSPEQFVCFGYIQGIIDTTIFTAEAFQKTPLGSEVITCMPDGVPEKVIQGIIERYLGEHPDQLKYSAISEIEAALMEAYPCPEKSN